MLEMETFLLLLRYICAISKYNNGTQEQDKKL